MKSINLFFISAACFFAANNLHFIIDNGFIPRILDLVGVIAIGAGIYFQFKKE